MSASVIELIDLYDEYLRWRQDWARDRFERNLDLTTLGDSFGDFMEWLKRKAGK